MENFNQKFINLHYLPVGICSLNLLFQISVSYSNRLSICQFYVTTFYLPFDFHLIPFSTELVSNKTYYFDDSMVQAGNAAFT